MESLVPTPYVSKPKFKFLYSAFPEKEGLSQPVRDRLLTEVLNPAPRLPLAPYKDIHPEKYPVELPGSCCIWFLKISCFVQQLFRAPFYLLDQILPDS